MENRGCNRCEQGPCGSAVKEGPFPDRANTRAHWSTFCRCYISTSAAVRVKTLPRSSLRLQGACEARCPPLAGSPSRHERTRWSVLSGAVDARHCLLHAPELHPLSGHVCARRRGFAQDAERSSECPTHGLSEHDKGADGLAKPRVRADSAAGCGAAHQLPQRVWCVPHPSCPSLRSVGSRFASQLRADGITRSKLSQLDGKLAKLERRMEVIEGTLQSVDQGA